jgi:hypothetical protein
MNGGPLLLVVILALLLWAVVGRMNRYRASGSCRYVVNIMFRCAVERAVVFDNPR